MSSNGLYLCIYITVKNQVQNPSTITSKHFVLHVLIIRFSDKCKRKGRLRTVRQQIFLYLICTCLCFQPINYFHQHWRESDVSLPHWHIYRVIHKSLRDFRTRLCNNQDRHAERSISIGRESLKVFFCTRGLGILPGSTARG